MDTYHKAPFWKRALAAVIDGIFLGLILIVVTVPISVLARSTGSNGILPMVIVVLSIILFYEPLLLSMKGATLGKMLMHIWVIGKEQQRLTLIQAFLRGIAKVGSGIFSLGYLWVLIDPKRQGWHDKIAGTYVITVDQENHPVIGHTPPVSTMDKVLFAILLVMSILTTVSRASNMAIKESNIRTGNVQQLQKRTLPKNIKIYTPSPKQRN